MMKILTVAQMQQAERDCAQFGISLAQLMENAGKAVALQMRKLLGEIQKQRIVVLAGPGNNGGDGLVAARYLHDWGAKVFVYSQNPQALNTARWEQLARREILLLDADSDPECSELGHWLEDSNAVLDALFGTGRLRPLTGVSVRILSALEIAKKKHPLTVISLDLPSGLNADTGTADPATPCADYTFTLGFPKLGLFQSDGIDKSGKISIIDIGIPPLLVDHVEIELLTGELINKLLPERPLSSHKGTYGKILAFTGSVNYPGAAYLSCMGSIRVGAGLTTLAIARSLLPILATKLTEVVFLPLPEDSAGFLSAESANLLSRELEKVDCWLLGCGLGQSNNVHEVLERLLLKPSIRLPKMVLDADGLGHLTRLSGWQKSLKAEAIFTPHTGEMARLSGRSVTEIQANRFEVAREFAVEWKQTLVLKGAYSIIATSQGKLFVSPFVNPGLASAGTGDVLAGTIAGMVAQGLELPAAAVCGVYLHGLAGDIIRSEIGETGMLASDLLPALPRAIRQLRYG
jgi:ADP-dependent NAD(P)H-hydrate dehydratase / NAD(P)H-hydrate epimerase